jgi:hypothetical protein
MEQVGYSLIDSNNKEVQFWGDTPGRSISAPDMLFLANDISVCAPNIGVSYSGYTLVPRYIESNGIPELKSGEEYSCDGSKVIITYTYRDPNKIELSKYSANARYTKETSGTIVSNNFIYTDRQSQAMINGIVTLLQLQPNTTINFKTGNGFIPANSQVISEIASAVAYHVQSCFDIEANVNVQIENDTITKFSEIDLFYYKT